MDNFKVINPFIMMMVLTACREKALEFDVPGTAMITILDEDDVCMGTWHLIVSGKNGHSGNEYYAFAASKIAQMMETKKDSGPQQNQKKWWCGYRGGIYRLFEGDQFLIAFSGGREDDDVKIALAGWQAFEDFLRDSLKDFIEALFSDDDECEEEVNDNDDDDEGPFTLFNGSR